MNNKKMTIKYYSEHVSDYIADTNNADMNYQYGLFEKYLTSGDKVLEIGFGGGRDFIYFSKKYKMYGIDITPEFYEKMKLKGYNVILCDANSFQYDFKFDGIWACASLLHLERSELRKIFLNCYNHLNKNGVIYCSFKYGEFDGVRNGRYFLDLTENSFKDIIEGLNFKIVEQVITNDVRSERSDRWLNIVMRKL